MSSSNSRACFRSGLPDALRFTSSDDFGPLQHRQDGCSYSKTSRSRCVIDKNSEGNLVKKCEKTEQLLRHCVGKPTEIVESKSEHTEEDAPSGWVWDSIGDEGRDFGKFPFGTPSIPRGPSDIPSLPGRPYGMDPFSKGLTDGFESFIHAAEEMMNGFINQLGFDKRHEEGDAGSRWSWKRVPDDRKLGRRSPSSPPQNRIPHKEPEFSSFSKDFEEI